MPFRCGCVVGRVPDQRLKVRVEAAGIAGATRQDWHAQYRHLAALLIAPDQDAHASRLRVPKRMDELGSARARSVSNLQRRQVSCIGQRRGLAVLVRL